MTRIRLLKYDAAARHGLGVGLRVGQVYPVSTGDLPEPWRAAGMTVAVEAGGIVLGLYPTEYAYLPDNPILPLTLDEKTLQALYRYAEGCGLDARGAATRILRQALETEPSFTLTVKAGEAQETLRRLEEEFGVIRDPQEAPGDEEAPDPDPDPPGWPGDAPTGSQERVEGSWACPFCGCDLGEARWQLTYCPNCDRLLPDMRREA